ncbi:Dihydrolipoyllysine-residue acetyltransferase component of pyruvate dehydrogenase complex [Candidatus Erwinia haradaeae]|uniref:Dihydrolipoamide acetyltransferase component of pyruvate dehydrogenase complex n=1 Tax=Candidatus Erwinia haradaeae TaxID=1922217 RepID=A0A451D2A9_9GAMM|nr:2-oxo acid dehydrogenase subunit E2 [Candidatus Erwinia haradaeae]VFP79767.1 Dihydrolipoyllysine-residue acetyltransferase component of pyruvate dehydrogenase complex [Candidatus Erwinia haradaeae]
MSIKIHVPDIGTDVVEVIEVLVKIGDIIEYEQPLLTIEGDKALMEVPSPYAGIVKEIMIQPGDKIHSGEIIMIAEATENTHASVLLENSKKKEKILSEPEGYKKIYAPKNINNDFKISKILVTIGEKINTSDTILSIRNEQKSIDIQTPFSGTIEEITVKNGDKISNNMLLMIINNKPIVSCSKSDVMPNEDQVRDQRIKNHTYIHATPLVRRLARLFGVNLNIVQGTGIKSRIMQEDLHQYIQNSIKYTEKIIKHSGQPLDIPLHPKTDYSKFGEIQEIEISRIQKKSGENLKRNWSIIPHVTLFDKTDITDLEEFRKIQNNEEINHQSNIKLTSLIFVIKSVAMALEKMPHFNSTLSEDEEKLILKKYIHIGVAVDTPHGLVVPVYKNVNKKNITELSCEITQKSKKARDGQLTISDMQGGCFTISSIGSLGTTYFSPIVNAPEVAILGISKSLIEPVWNGKKFIPRLIMPMSLSFDHRVINGADGARFMNIIKKTLSDIRQLVM